MLFAEQAPLPTGLILLMSVLVRRRPVLTAGRNLGDRKAFSQIQSGRAPPPGLRAVRAEVEQVKLPRRNGLHNPSPKRITVFQDSQLGGPSPPSTTPGSRSHQGPPPRRRRPRGGPFSQHRTGIHAGRKNKTRPRPNNGLASTLVHEQNIGRGNTHRDSEPLPAEDTRPRREQPKRINTSQDSKSQQPARAIRRR